MKNFWAKVPRVWKFIVALVPLVIFVGNEAVQQLEVLGADGEVTSGDMFRIIVTAFTAVGVYEVKNAE